MKVIYRVVLGLVALFTMDSCVSDRTDEMRGVKEEVVLSLSRGEEVTLPQGESLKDIRFYFFKRVVQDSLSKYVFSKVVDFVSEDELTGIPLEQGVYRVVAFANYSEEDFTVSELVEGKTILEDVRVSLKEGRQVPELLKGEEILSVGGEMASLNVTLSRGMISKVQFDVTTRPQGAEKVSLKLRIPSTVFNMYGLMCAEEGVREEEVELDYVEDEKCFRSAPMFLFFMDKMELVFNIRADGRDYEIEYTRGSGLLTNKLMKINSTVSLMDRVVVQDVILGDWDDQGETNLEAPLFRFTFRKHKDDTMFPDYIFLRDEKSGKILAYEKFENKVLDDGRFQISIVYPWDGEFTICGIGVNSLYRKHVVDFPEDLKQKCRISLPEDMEWELDDSIVIHSQYWFGEGTEENPFLVHSATSLNNVGGSGNYFKQVCNIDLHSMVFGQGTMGWNFGLSYNMSLDGNSVYNGCGYVIRGGQDCVKDEYWHLFDNYGQNGTIKNVRLEVMAEKATLVRYNKGNILNCCIEGKSGTHVVLVGESDENAVIENSFCRSEGGQAECVEGGCLGTVRNCYVMGEFGESLKGVFGTVYTSSQVINSYAVSKVIGSEGKTGNYSMVFQREEALNMLGCYYDNDVCPYKGVYRSDSEESFDVAGKVEGKSSVAMKNQVTYVGWKFGEDDKNPWKMDAGVNGGYPYLYWEK